MGHVLAVHAASMGPRPEDRGEFIGVASIDPDDPLQWGHGPKTVESRAGLAVPPSMDPLQWGHGPKTVERRPGHRSDWSWSKGFNGATARRPWRVVERAMDLRSIRRLQWGHGPKTVERGSKLTEASIAPVSFNGATARRPWREGSQYH